jgi:hypothetical protein
MDAKEDRRALSDGNVENDRDFRTVVGKKGDFRFIRQTYLEEGLHSMQGLPNVIDVRNIGPCMGAIELEPYPECPGRRGTRSHGAVLRGRGDGASEDTANSVRPT